MNLKNQYKIFLWYLKKHGLIRFIGLLLFRFWRNYVNNKEAMFLFDLETMNINNINYLENLSVTSYKCIEDIPQNDIEQLFRLKNKEIILTFLTKFFHRGATLWLAKINNTVVSLQWTLIGGFDGFYSFPIYSNDVILLAAEVFPEFRGRSIYSGMTRLIFSRLKNKGISRIYFKVHVHNTSSLRSASKTNSKIIGIVRTIKLFNLYITIWDKNKSTVS